MDAWSEGETGSQSIQWSHSLSGEFEAAYGASALAVFMLANAMLDGQGNWVGKDWTDADVLQCLVIGLIVGKSCLSVSIGVNVKLLF